jgi:heme O synthase-like polyprenyltransferase
MSIPAYIKIARFDHLIKNTLIFIPLFFSAGLFNDSLIAGTVFGFICFSLLSSIVYILNDIMDMEKDRLHSTKCRRPLASEELYRKENEKCSQFAGETAANRLQATTFLNWIKNMLVFIPMLFCEAGHGYGQW